MKFPETFFTFVLTDFVQYAQDAGGGGTNLRPDHRQSALCAHPALEDDVRSRIKAGYGLTGRTDLAFAFILAFIRLLSIGGRAGVITSNRLLSTDAGKPVRAALLCDTNITELWDLGDTRLFDAAVLPAVLFFEKSAEGKTGAGEAPSRASTRSPLAKRGSCQIPRPVR